MTKNGALYATTGARLWRYQAGNTLVTAPVIANGIVYIGTRPGGVAAFAARQGPVLSAEYLVPSAYHAGG